VRLKTESSYDRVFETEQVIDCGRDEVFAFFADPRNLERITPRRLRFRIVYPSATETREGTSFTYRMRIHGTPVKWKTRIAEWQPATRFVDVQLEGPYSHWHHTHTFDVVVGGTRIRDRVVYRLPFGSFGLTVAGRFVERDLRRIFRYRSVRTAEILSAGSALP